MPQKLKTDKARELFWRKVLARHRDSGLSQAAFCKREGFGANTFSTWKKVIANIDIAAGGEHPAPEMPNMFVPVSVTQEPAEGPPSPYPVAEIDLAACTVRIFNGIDAQSLTAILNAIREAKR